jgi:signal transduction histidine kinase
MPPPVQNAPSEGAEQSRRPARAAGALRNLAMEESRRSFLRMVSHELRTPLNSVIGFSEIISRELYGPISDPRYRDHAQMVHQSGLRLLKLVNDVLDIARLEAGTMDLDLRPEEPLTALEEAMRGLSAEAAERTVRLQLSASAETPLVVADGRGLQTIFINLIQNAIAHSPAGGTVEIRSRTEGDEVVFEIADQGQGVSKEDLARILKPFEQAESALIRRSEGAGLGLAMVGLLCRAMNGQFSVRSNPGEGLTAVVRLSAVERFAAV